MAQPTPLSTVRRSSRVRHGWLPSVGPRRLRNGSLSAISTTRAEKRKSFFSSPSTILSTAQRSCDSRPRPRANVSIFSARQRANSVSAILQHAGQLARPGELVAAGQFARRIDRRARRPDRASGRSRQNSPGQSRAGPSSCGTTRRRRSCGESRAACGARAPAWPCCVASSSGTSGGGSGGGEPRMFSRIHLPRFTGDVRPGLLVSVRMLACVSTPARRSSVNSRAGTRRRESLPMP